MEKVYLSFIFAVFLCVNVYDVEALGKVCTMPKETGPCRQHLPRYYFNSKSGKCEQFVYGGCRGNGNNFASAAKCLTLCGKDSANLKADVCSLPKDAGPCKAAFPRFYFSSATGKCQKFYYGGCGGNGNNFVTADECDRACRSVVLKSADKPVAQELERSDTCSSPKDRGICMAYIERFFFNTATGRCEKFVYGGCMGNKNNFMTGEECQTACGGPIATDTATANGEEVTTDDLERLSEIKEEPEEDSDSESSSDSSSESSSENSVENSSAKKRPSKCLLPSSRGLCMAYIERFYFNSDKGKCEKFVFGGCMGNRNNFITMEKCESSCAEQFDNFDENSEDSSDNLEAAESDENENTLCRLPLNYSFWCLGYFRHFYYDTELGRCNMMVFGGCGGEKGVNIFSTLEQCQEKCANRKVRNHQSRTTPSHA